MVDRVFDGCLLSLVGGELWARLGLVGMLDIVFSTRVIMLVWCDVVYLLVNVANLFESLL